jgi:uncharacterized membrane protein
MSERENVSASKPVMEEPVWTYRGYRIRPGEFVTAMVHFFRAEIQRANVWRTRLDATTNWAVVTTGAALSIAFSQGGVHHGVLILNTLLVTMFLFIEARRYRYYELWSYRIRLMETDFYAAMLVPPFHPSPEWAESLAESLLLPRFPISMLEALGRRLRRNYLPIYAIQAFAWIARGYLFPTPLTDVGEFFQRAAIGPIPGNIVVLLGALFYFFLLSLAVGTIGMTNATGEVLPRFGENGRESVPLSEKGLRSWFVPHRHRRQYLAIIITDKEVEVSQRILNDLRRGVTALPGKGMYTGQARGVLLCALTVTEINHLRQAVHQADPQAFVVITQAHSVFGRGFLSLAEEKHPA